MIPSLSPTHVQTVLAAQSINFVKKICIYGADNSPSLSLENWNHKTDEEKKDRVILGNDLRILGLFLEKENDSFTNKKLIPKASVAITLRTGRSGEQSKLLACYLLARGYDNFKFVSLDNHTFVVMNFPESGLLLNPETIPQDSIIVDPWADESYPTQEFAERQKVRAFLQGNPVISSWQDYFHTDESTNRSEFFKRTITSLVQESTNTSRLHFNLLRMHDTNGKFTNFNFRGYTNEESEEIQEMLNLTT